MNPNSWELPPIPIGTESWLIFAVVLIALIISVWQVARLVTRVTDDSDPAETDRQMLTAINDLHRNGDLSRKEFRSIKSQLVDRLLENRSSSAVRFSGKGDHAGSTDHSVETSVSTSIERQDTIVDSTTRSDLPETPDSSNHQNQDESKDNDQT